MSESQNGGVPIPRTRVITIAVGGATCSGKSTLAKHLKNCLYDSFIIHQDDFAPPQERIPIHPKYDCQDWDDAPGAVDWPRYVGFLEDIKRTGILPETYDSRDHLNEYKDIPANDEMVMRWRRKSERVATAHQAKYGERLVWALVDGFLMYWNQQVVDLMDARIFLRVPHDILKQRRHERHGYHTAEGALWRDPPQYWEHIVYPAYVRAHSNLFEGGDVEHGKPTDKVADLLLFEGTQINMDAMITTIMEKILEVTEARQ